MIFLFSCCFSVSSFGTTLPSLESGPWLSTKRKWYYGSHSTALSSFHPRGCGHGLHLIMLAFSVFKCFR
uniref:Putative secreted protein n=1 Tax=Xenopsylla cheopis TaxID=163159 RepID=A0A6M2DXV1_XENCH